MRSKEGMEIPVEISAKMLPDGRMLGIVRDHSARLLAERKLFKEKDLSDQIINSLPGIFYLSDQTPRLIRWNKKLEMISGYTADELAAIKPLTLFDIADHDRMMRAMKKAYEDGYGSAEGTLIAKDATRTTYFSTAVRIDYEGRPAILGTGIDITDQKKAQEQILKANELFQLVTRATHDVVWDWDLRTDGRWWNENFYSLLGDQQETDQNNLRLWMNALHEEDRERVISGIQYAIQNHHDDWKDEYQFTKKDGTVLFIYDRGYILYDADGKPYRMIGAMMDVTKRKQAELELTAKESRLRAILTVEPECIKLLNEKGELLEMNPAGLAMIEAENEDQVIGQRLDSLVLKPYKSLFNRLIKDVFSGRSGKLEFEITGLKGTKRWLETNAVPFRSSEGKIISLLGVTQDITERKKAEQSLREAEERYRKIFQNATEGIYQSTPEGKFITANHALAKMFGYDSASELISEISSINTQIYADPQQREHIMKLLEKQDRVTYFEMKAFKKDKRIIWVRDHIHAIRDQRGNIQYFEGTLEDITERKNAEEKLTIQFDQLQKTNYELDRFVYSVSHDLRAPLSSIMGLVNIAEMDNPNQNQLKYLQLIRESVLRLDGFIHDILDYSRNTRQEITIAKVDLNDILRSIQNNLSHLKGMENLNVKMDVGNNVIFNSDPVRLKIILSNLFSNAIKYQDVTKKESYLSIQATIDAQQCNIFFKDNGIGIDQTQINHVFDMFYRASNLSNGSGLGLYIARETVARLGGTISVKSELGKFSQFEICIPNLIP
jgi:PAS domain S-box-containing protein